METDCTYPCSYSWTHPPLRFALQTDDPAVAQRASQLFSYWPAASADSENLELLVMTVNRTAAGWSFRGSQSDQPLVYRDLPTVMRAAETDAAFAILAQHNHFLSVHGALLALRDDAIMIVGPSESGKSTTSCALWAAGWELLTDDVTLLEPAAATAYPLLRRVSLRHPSKALLGDQFWHRITSSSTCDPTPEGYVFHPDELQTTRRARSAKLRAILFLKRLGAPDPGAAALSVITSAQALLALSPYTNVIRSLGLGEAISRLGPLLDQVPCYDLGRGPLPDMINTIEALVEEPSLVH